MTSSPPPQNPAYDLFGVIVTVGFIAAGAIAACWYFLGAVITFAVVAISTQLALLTVLVLILLAIRDLVSELRVQRLSLRTGPPTGAGRVDS